MKYKKKLNILQDLYYMLKNALKANKLRDGREHDENQYLNLIDDIIKEGEKVTGRNGTVYMVSGSAMHFSLENKKIPLLTTKKVALKTCLKELLWFIKGSTNNKLLQEQNVKIWNGNASRSFLDSRGLHNLEENDLGPIYGHQWRHFNASYDNCNVDYKGKGVDQLDYVIQCLKDPRERWSRRILMSAWNPCQIEQMALPPCHVLVQFNVLPPNKLCCSLYQRSGDIGLGVPFNIASYSYLTHLLAHHCNLEPFEFNYYLGNCHIYDDHIDALKTQMIRAPFEFPTLSIKKTYSTIEEYTCDDFEINDYISHKSVQMQMRE